MILTVTLNPSLDEWIKLAALRMGELNRASYFMRYAGGKGINVSRVIRELGGRTLALGFAGGEDGLILHALMNRLKVAHDFVAIAGATRNNYKIETQKPNRITEINSPGPRITAANLSALTRRVKRSLSNSRCIVLSGSLPPGAGLDSYARLIRLARQKAVAAVLDASGEALRLGLAATPWLIKPNKQEAEELLGHRIGESQNHLAKAVKALLKLGPRMVILSLGKEGALMGEKSTGSVWRARSPKVRAQSSVGAGDSLVAGFVLGWQQKQSLPEALRLGIACGAATALTPGTELCHVGDVRRLLPRVRIKPL